MGNKVVLTAEMMAEILKTRPATAHKGMIGHALLVAGSPGMAGCAVLAAEACLRSGVGKLTVHTQEENRLILQTAVPEACLYIGNKAGSEIIASLSDEHIKGIGIGPGIGTSSLPVFMTNQYLLKKKFQDAGFVLDADALTIMASRPKMAEACVSEIIMTPHMGEMMRLAKGFGLNTEDLTDAAATLAADYGFTIILKGHPTHIFTRNKEVLACPRGNAGMATAGSGDVLTGLITGLLAQGYSVKEAAMLGVWLHASAGDAAARQLGQECMLARDITRHLPEAFRELHQLKATLPPRTSADSSDFIIIQDLTENTETEQEQE